MSNLTEQLLREKARAFACDLNNDEHFRQAASEDPESDLVYGIESGFINGYKRCLADIFESLAR